MTHEHNGYAKILSSRKRNKERKEKNLQFDDKFDKESNATNKYPRKIHLVDVLTNTIDENNHHIDTRRREIDAPAK